MEPPADRRGAQKKAPSERAPRGKYAGGVLEYDTSAKKLVSQKSILAYILKSTMDEFSDVSVKQIAEELIEGSPQVAEVAVHQDTPDAPKDNFQLECPCLSLASGGSQRRAEESSFEARASRKYADGVLELQLTRR